MKMEIGGKVAYLIFLMVGLTLMFSGGNGLVGYFTFTRNAIEHTGIIFRIDTIQQDADKVRMLTVKYSVSGQEYESRIKDYWGMKTGDEMKIFYNSRKPSEIQLNADTSFLTGDVIFLSMGLLFFLIGIFGILSKKKKSDIRNVTNANDAVPKKDVFTLVKDSVGAIKGTTEISDQKLEGIADAGANLFEGRKSFSISGKNQAGLEFITHLPTLMALGRKKIIRLHESITLDELYRLLTERWNPEKFGSIALKKRNILVVGNDFTELTIAPTNYFDLRKFKNIKNRWIEIEIIQKENLRKEEEKRVFVKSMNHFLALRAELLEILGSRVDMKYETNDKQTKT